jgi:fructose-specific component phosphotransferase system IIB-like protein
MLLLLLLTAVIVPVCVLLIFHPDYEDGFFGRIGLTLIGIAGFARLVSVFGDAHPVTPIGMVLWLGVAIFLVRHCWRFLRRGHYHPTPYQAKSNATAGKRASESK